MKKNNIYRDAKILCAILLLSGLGFIFRFFLEDALLLTENIRNWPRARATVISSKKEEICDNQEGSTHGNCYKKFFIIYSYSVDNKVYENLLLQEYFDNFPMGKVFDVYYNKKEPAWAFSEVEIPRKEMLVTPLIAGIILLALSIILGIYIKIDKHNYSTSV